MLPDIAAAQSPDITSPTPNDVASNGGSTNGTRAASNGNGKTGGVQQNGAAAGQFPPPKTDKPRPHVCNTCGRSFARLEHLKRHERSHTKEKPFECPECTRCFARRDLLLRHQQKLHMTNTTSSRPRNGRRESAGGSAGSGRVRKNSVANAALGGSGGIGPTAARPRANTMSHIELSSLGLIDGLNPAMGRMNGLGITSGHAMSFGGLSGPINYDYRGVTTPYGQQGNLHGLPKLDTHAVSMDLGGAVRTAPPYAGFGGFDLDQLFSPGNTINPAQLHFAGAQSASATHYTPFSYVETQPQIDEGDDFGWMRGWGMNMTSNDQNNDIAIEESSPSRMSSGDSTEDTSEMANSIAMSIPQLNVAQWSAQDMQTQMMMQPTPFQMEALNSDLPNANTPVGTVSPQNLHDPTSAADAYLRQSMMQNPQLEPLQNIQTNYYPASMSNFDSDSPSMSSSSMTGSARQSSVTSASTDSITDATRHTLLMSLAQPSVFGHNHRKYSQPTISSPLSPGGLRGSVQGPSLPSTHDIRRYVDAFIQYAHPHVPALHIPTLSFDSLDYSSNLRGSQSQGGFGNNGIVGGGGCLILAMAAIGALYEYDHPASKELFEAAKKMMMLNLEERRKADMSAAVNGANVGLDGATNHTPLWLVQAMLLNVIYGHQCGDKTAADIASTHCAALVSLARSAKLTQPPGDVLQGEFDGSESHVASNQRLSSEDVLMSDASMERAPAVEPPQLMDETASWLKWKTTEERKRTLFAVFILSSTLVTAYNQTPAIMNSEIVLDLPCDEELWSAETAQEWAARGGQAAADASAVSFAGALSTLLTANQRQNNSHSTSSYNNSVGAVLSSDVYQEHELRPSTFGCLVLINALHNYIWETRSRHHGRQWTAQETESMFSHIEPALNAWQAAWKANEHHKLERPNPFGLGPLSADSIPLLDLAFVRLFVNLGRSKEAFWQRDFDGMADELARGAEIVQHAEGSPGAENASSTDAGHSANSPPSTDAANARRNNNASQPSSGQSSKRERHLRKAAFYAADSLTIACSYNLTYADPTAHELPIQSAMCFFDCGQVLAEWASTVQERVGRYLGILGKDDIDYTQVPAIMLLETEDVELLKKIERICESVEAKRFQQENLLAMDLRNLDPASAMNAMKNTIDLNNCGHGSKILKITAMMLEKAVVWPVTHVMAKALETQAAHMNQRAEASITAP